jgi:hypothetical protein
MSEIILFLCSDKYISEKTYLIGLVMCLMYANLLETLYQNWRSKNGN